MSRLSSVTQNPDDRLTKFLILRVLLDKISALQRLLRYALNNFLHRFDLRESCLCERNIYFVHLREERENGDVAIVLV